MNHLFLLLAIGLTAVAHGEEDVRSWDSMMNSFKELMPSHVMVGVGNTRHSDMDMKYVNSELAGSDMQEDVGGMDKKKGKINLPDISDSTTQDESTEIVNQRKAQASNDPVDPSGGYDGPSLNDALSVPTMSPTFILDAEPVQYRNKGVDLVGYKVTPIIDSGATVPAIVIVSDWEGVDWDEQTRAEMVAKELGYVGFVADIYGGKLNEIAFENITTRLDLYNLYTGNTTLFTDRIKAAVDTVRTFPEVDPKNVAIIGYGFGGTGVLLYGLLGINNVKALVSFHGGLSRVLEQNPRNATPKILVLSGGADDISKEVVTLENTLEAANSDWEITRYSGIEHAFTKWNDDRFDTWADMRSWHSMKGFLKEAFGETAFISSPPDNSTVESVPYEDIDGTELQGYLALPNATTYVFPLPLVVILPDWDGVNEYEKERAVLLAESGYIAFAADIFGADKQNDLTLEERIEYTDLYRGNSTLFVQRIERAIEVGRSISGVNSGNIAVIGYCFGGTGIIELAFGSNADVNIVVSFHGGLADMPRALVGVKPYVLILSGGIDDANGNVTELEDALNNSSAHWESTRYSGVDHGFTAWSSVAYSPKADVRSWDSMMTAFKEIIAIPMLNNDPPPTNAPTSAPTSASDRGTIAVNSTQSAGAKLGVKLARSLLTCALFALL